MSDWSIYEFDDIVWDEFGSSYDHIVPHPFKKSSVEYLQRSECYKKLRVEAGSSVGTVCGTIAPKNVLQVKERTNFQSTLENGKAPMLDKGSWSQLQDSIFSGSDSGCVNLVTNLVHEDPRVSNSCYRNSNVESGATDFCTDNTILGNEDAMIDNGFSDFQLDDISAAESHLEFFRSGPVQKENGDLLYYEWPDIGNFEDVDRMFRKCDSTFGQGNIVPIKELSCFSSSSHPNDVSDDTSKSGFGASCVEDILEKDSCNWDISGHFACDDWVDTDNETKQESTIDQVQEHYDSEINISSQRIVSNEDSATGFKGSSEEKIRRKQPKDHQCSSQVLSQQRPLWDASSFGQLHTYLPCGYHDYVTPEEKVKVIHRPKKIQSAMSKENQNDQFMHDTRLKQIPDEVEGDNEVVKVKMDFSSTGVNSNLQESSCMSSVLSNDISLEATSFRQLKDVMERLDIKTKLCIRDSLYRLARSAKQRHNFDRANSSKRDRSGSGTTSEDGSKMHDLPRCLGFIDPETDTNPIDRSIAHLLFYGTAGGTIDRAI